MGILDDVDWLYSLVGQEEIKVRQDPAARVTDLRKTVFGGKSSSEQETGEPGVKPDSL